MNSESYFELNRALSRLEPGVGAAELHGSLSGFLCAGGRADPASWLDALALRDLEESLAVDDRVVFDRLYCECLRELDDPELAFDPLLPDDESPLTERSAALVEWCRGFLGGLGLAGADLRHALSADANEVLADFARIARTEVEAEDMDSEGEDDYCEVLEYVRVGAMLLRHELSVPASATRH
jgi:hypothetical protein